MDWNWSVSLEMVRRFSSDSQPNLDIIEEMLLVLLESLQTNLADLRCTASNVCESHTEAQYSNLGLTKV